MGLALLVSSPAYAKVDINLDSSRSIEMTCGGTEVKIECGYNDNFTEGGDDRICSANKLILTLKSGEAIHPKPPETFEQGATPIGIECARERTNPQKNLILIQYLSFGSYDCAKCFQDIVLTPEGELVSRNTDWSSNRLSRERNAIQIETRYNKLNTEKGN